MKLYRQKSMTVEVIQYTGDNGKECEVFVGDNVNKTLSYPHVIIDGNVESVYKNDYIVKEEYGFWVYHPAEFNKLYELVENQPTNNGSTV